MNKYNITIGSDPEIFIEENGQVASAIGLVPGTKYQPHPIDHLGHMIQTDNIALEYNIPPCTNEDDFVYSIKYVKDYLEAIVVANGYTLSTKASAEVNPIYLMDPQAQRFGCSPDLNVYTGEPNEAPDNNTNLRCVGGHYSIGYPNPTIEISEKIVKAFDIFVTLPSLLIDKDERRRELYGKAGCFRFTPYGVECRQLSNFWIHNEDLTRWVYRQGLKAIECVLDGKADNLINNYSQLVVEAINTNNKQLAEQLLESIGISEVVLIN